MLGSQVRRWPAFMPLNCAFNTSFFQAVAKDYASRQVNVIAMSQFDMTAWVKRGTKEEAGMCIASAHVNSCYNVGS